MENIVVKEMNANLVHFKEALHKGKVSFSYRKKDGSIREAVGTLNVDVMGEDNAPSGNGNTGPENQIRYFDLNSNGWRSFLSENLIDWDDIDWTKIEV